MSDKSIKEIREIIQQADIKDYDDLINEYSSDNRSGVFDLVKSMIKKRDKFLIEKKRIDNIKQLELSLYNEGKKYIAGLDEVGRGPLCGPVVSAAVIMPKDTNLLYINDSKKLSKSKREELLKEIKKEAVAIGIGEVDNKEIDEINILNAAKKSMLLAIENLSVKPDFILTDALKLDIDIPQENIIKGDEKVYCIGSASIVAKCYRDSLMEEYSKKYPEYKWEKNMGYGTEEHMKAIEEYGLTPLHRKSFLKNYTESNSSVEDGREYEEVASNYLKRKGYEILERNYAKGGGEIDIICRKDNIIVFAEVKGRKEKSKVKPKEAVTEKKQRNIKNTAEAYISEKKIKNLCRFDVVEIIPSGFAYKINHIENAFD